MKDLRDLVGKEEFKKAARSYIQQGFERAWKTDKKSDELVFDADAFRKTLGLTTDEGKQRLATLFEGTGVKPQQLDDFVKMMKANEQFTIPSVSVFLQRRVTLGGLGSLWAAGKAGQKSVLGGLTTLALMRKGANLLSSPKNLEIMTKAFKDDVPTQVRRNAVLRLVRELGDDERLPSGDAKAWEEMLKEAEKQGNAGGPVSDLQKVILDARPELKDKVMRALQND